jgi:isopentenyl-diphosphate Delta-isomerase
VDPLQAQYMEEEMCVGVTFDDKPVKPLSKKAAHLVKNKSPILHRAFSVFLFDEEGRLLLQRRAGSKITFPLFWTNTCCSHPLWTPAELGEDVGEGAKEEAAVVGCKRAAIRKLEHELGIPASAFTPEELVYSEYVWVVVGSCGCRLVWALVGRLVG